MAEEYSNQNAKKVLVADSDPAVLQAMKISSKPLAFTPRPWIPTQWLPSTCAANYSPPLWWTMIWVVQAKAWTSSHRLRKSNPIPAANARQWREYDEMTRIASKGLVFVTSPSRG